MTAWFAVRHIIEAGPVDQAGVHSYEERITIWRAAKFDAAYALALGEAQLAASYLKEGAVLDLFHVFRLFDDPSYGANTPSETSNEASAFTAAHGAEVFSLIRDSELSPRDYLDQFFDTGWEQVSTRVRIFGGTTAT